MEEATPKIASKGQEPDMSRESAEGAPASSSTEACGREIVEKRPKFYVGKSPVKFDFHFPEEVWQIILDLLTEDDDRTNCCRAFPLFDKLLTKSKPVWMFKKVLPFLDNEVLETEDILICRRICRQWCDDIEQHLTIDEGQLHFVENLYPFESVEELDRFTKKFEGHTRNPFIHSVVSIHFCPEDEFQNKLLDIFSKFGRYICFLTIEWDLPPLDYYRVFQRILTMTPNLKEITSWYTYDTISPDMAENPLPDLPAFRKLDLWSSGTEDLTNPNSFIHALILRYGAQLQTMIIGFESCVQVFTDQLPNLTKLEIREIANDEALEGLLLLTSPLKRLDLEMSRSIENNQPDSAITVSSLLRVIQHFPSLEEVWIGIEIGGGIDTQADISHVQISTVRIVGVNDDGRGPPVSLNFLQAFKAMEKLFVGRCPSKKRYLGINEGQDELQLYKILKDGKVYESNIWNLIPTLKTVEIYSDYEDTKMVGNRRGFQDHQAK